MKGKELTLNYIRDKIKSLQRDYKTVQRDLRVELDSPTKNRLKDRLEDISQKIDTLELKEAAIQQELLQGSAQSALSTLANILQLYVGQFSDMRTAYLAVLRHRGWSSQNDPKTPDEIIRQLVRIPKGQNYEAYEEFVARLVTHSQVNDLVLGLQHWGEQHLNEAWAILLQQVTQQQVEQQQQVQTALLILISRSDEASTQKQSEVYYQTKVWLINDIQHYREFQEGISSIGISELTGDETYAQSDLSWELPKLVCRFLTEISDQIDNDPEVHIFLPLELMNQNVDLWLLDDGYGQPQPLGHQYKVVLRCTERLSRSYRQTPRWRKKWMQHQSLLNQLAHTVFMRGDDSDLVSLSYDLDEAEDTVVGLKVVQAPNFTGADSLFGVLLQLGIPLAIWGRSNLEVSSNEAELDRVLNVCRLENLPHTVKEERRNARRTALNEHIGHHLSLLWDDPYLVPPKSA